MTQGRGIRLVMGGGSERRLLAALGGAGLEGGAAVAQRYVADPLLVNGLKFDLRVFCLVSSVEPLRCAPRELEAQTGPAADRFPHRRVTSAARRVFLYREGLMRFCTTPYERPAASNVCQATMHLTNYAVNKRAAAFVAPAAAAEAGPGREAGSTGSSSSVDDADTAAADEAQQWQEQGGGEASKWSFKQLRQYLVARGALVLPPTANTWLLYSSHGYVR
jgi:hypothetical protein